MTETPKVDAEFVNQCLEDFPVEVIGKLDRGRGVVLDYVGHAPLTAKLLRLDPMWDWVPLAYNEDGSPLIKRDSERGIASMWIKLTVRGMTRIGVGTCKLSKEEVEKELIGDALRNAAMRFGLALNLWAKGELEGADPATPDGAQPQTARQAPPQPRQTAPKPPPSPRAPRPAAAPSEAPSASAEADNPQAWFKRAQNAWRRVSEELRQEAIAHLMGNVVADPETGETLAVWPMPTLKILQEKPKLGRLAVTELEESIAVFLLGANEMVDS